MVDEIPGYLAACCPAVWVADRYGEQRHHGVARQLCLPRHAPFAIADGDSDVVPGFRRLRLRAGGRGPPPTRGAAGLGARFWPPLLRASVLLACSVILTSLSLNQHNQPKSKAYAARRRRFSASQNHQGVFLKKEQFLVFPPRTPAPARKIGRGAQTMLTPVDASHDKTGESVGTSADRASAGGYLRFKRRGVAHHVSRAQQDHSQ